MSNFYEPAKVGKTFQSAWFRAEKWIDTKLPDANAPLPNAGQPWPASPRFVRGTHNTKETTKGSNQSK